MDPADLANLRDIVAPPPISYWPLAPGWWVVGLALVALATIGLLRLLARYNANAYRRAALLELARLDGLAPVQQAQAISTILKRAALAAYPRADVAALTGAGWALFLDRTGRTEAFTRGAARGLRDAALGGRTAGDFGTIRREAVHWVRTHRGAEP